MAGLDPGGREGDDRAAFVAALGLTALLWTSSKHALIIGLTLIALAVARWIAGDRPARRNALRAVALVAAFGAGLSAFCVWPGLEEARHARLFAGEDVAGWQRQLAFKTHLSVLDRGGVLTAPLLEAAGRDGGETPARMRLLTLKMESGGAKYLGGVLLGLALGAAVFAVRRADRFHFWSLAAVLAACAALATGPASVWSANAATLEAVFTAPLVPGWLRLAVTGVLLLAVAAVVVLVRRLVGTPRRALAALAVTALMLFVPWFPLVARLPLFHDVRAPFAFFDIPATFAVALLAGFFLTEYPFDEPRG